MNAKIVIVCLHIVSACFVQCTAQADSLVDAVRRNNYEIDIHFVTTKDGYILKLYHMPPKRTNATPADTKPRIMFFSHGLFGTSAEFIAYQNSSASYFFVDQGYDVWMGNTRGTFLSLNHTTFKSNSLAYWQYSWHEIGVYDLPAQIDYVLEFTQQEQLSFVGHSQGGTVGFVLLAELPEYSKKVKIFHAMAPPVILVHCPLPAKRLTKYMKRVEKLAMDIKMYDVSPRWLLLPMVKLLGSICEMPDMWTLCRATLNSIVGTSAPRSWYPQIVSDIAKFHPAGASIYQVIHYGQLCATGQFRKFNYGTQENVKRYGSVKPPEYNLTNIHTTVHILHGNNDVLPKEKDIAILKKKLKNARVIDSMISRFNHFDFAYGHQVGKVQSRILEIENLFNPIR